MHTFDNFEGLPGALPHIPGTGMAGIWVQDCAGMPTVGLSIEWEGGGDSAEVRYVEMYLGNAWQPNHSATVKGARIINLEPGRVIVRAKQGDDIVASATIVIRAESVTRVFSMQPDSVSGT